MPRKPSNFTRLKHMTIAELADELKRICSSECFEYADLGEWLISSEETVIPHGRRIIAEITIREQKSRIVVDRVEIECIVISDSDILFNSRYYKIYDLTDGKIKSIPFDCLDIKELIENE